MYLLESHNEVGAQPPALVIYSHVRESSKMKRLKTTKIYFLMCLQLGCIVLLIWAEAG